MVKGLLEFTIRHVITLEELPMTPSGKVRKVELREMALEILGNPLERTIAKKP